jgi:hypothetical protein
MATHNPMMCPTCWTHLVLHGESFYNSKTGEHPNPTDLTRFTPTRAMMTIAQQGLGFGRAIQEGFRAFMTVPTKVGDS